MIIFMEENADMEELDNLVRVLMNQDVSVKIKDKNGDGFALALLGAAANAISASSVEQMPGVRRCAGKEESAKFYREHFALFRSCGSFFNWGY